MKQPRLLKRVERHLKELYTGKAAIYDRFSDCEDRENRIFKRVSSDIGFGNKTVLDIGCGSGKLTLQISKSAGIIYGLDSSKPLLKILKGKIRRRKIRNIRILEAGFNRIPLPDGSIDVVTSLWSFPVHSNDWERDLKEIKRVLRADGKIVLVNTHYGGEYYGIKKAINKPDLPVMKRFNDGIEKWLATKGFERKLLNVVVDFRTKKDVLELCPAFFGKGVTEYLLKRNKTGFGLQVAVFYWK